MHSQQRKELKQAVGDGIVLQLIYVYWTMRQITLAVLKMTEFRILTEPTIWQLDTIRCIVQTAQSTLMAKDMQMATEISLAWRILTV